MKKLEDVYIVMENLKGYVMYQLYGDTPLEGEEARKDITAMFAVVLDYIFKDEEKKDEEPAN